MKKSRKFYALFCAFTVIMLCIPHVQAAPVLNPSFYDVGLGFGPGNVSSSSSSGEEPAQNQQDQQQQSNNAPASSQQTQTGSSSGDASSSGLTPEQIEQQQQQQNQLNNLISRFLTCSSNNLLCSNKSMQPKTKKSRPLFKKPILTVSFTVPVSKSSWLTKRLLYCKTILMKPISRSVIWKSKLTVSMNSLKIKSAVPICLPNTHF